MYYSKEDIQPAVFLAAKIFGPTEQYHTWDEGRVMMNVAIMTRKLGKIWSGDLLLDKNAGITSDKLQKNLDILSDSIDQPVYLTEGDFDFTRAIAASQNSR